MFSAMAEGFLFSVMPQITTIEILARTLGVSPGWLAFAEGSAKGKVNG